MNFTFTPAILIDIALIVVVVATIVTYARKGFISGLISLVGNLASLVLAWVVSGKLSPTVFENFFKSGLITKTAEAIQTHGGLNLSAITEGLSGFVPQQFLDNLLSSAAGILDSNAPDIAQQVVEKVIAPLMVPIISVVVFFAAYAICKVLVAFLVAVLSNVNRIPLVGDINRLLGIVIGLIAGLLNVLIILCALWAIVAITNNNLPALNDTALSGSYFYTAFSTYNPFL